MPSRQKPAPPPIEVRQFTPEKAEWAVGLLSTRIEGVKALDPKVVKYADERVRAVGQRIVTNILEVFGENSREYREHQYHDVSTGRSTSAVGMVFDDSYDARRQHDFASQGIARSVTMLEALIETVRERTSLTTLSPTASARAVGDTLAVFIVHGRAEAVRESVARFVERLGLKPIILHEQANEGRTLIEKLEDHALSVGYAIILATGDDRGGPIGADPTTYQFRARQNVILELGYFHGKLGRGRVCLLYEEGVEIPSDYRGVAYVPLDAGDAWRLRLARELKQHFNIDLNRAV